MNLRSIVAHKSWISKLKFTVKKNILRPWNEMMNKLKLKLMCWKYKITVPKIFICFLERVEKMNNQTNKKWFLLRMHELQTCLINTKKNIEPWKKGWKFQWKQKPNFASCHPKVSTRNVHHSIIIIWLLFRW